MESQISCVGPFFFLAYIGGGQDKEPWREAPIGRRADSNARDNELVSIKLAEKQEKNVRVTEFRIK